MRIRWSSDLETGVRAIDRQHEELIGMLNELDAAHAGGCPQSVLDDVLQRLGTYVIFHFGTEEALMAGLPHNEEHARQHRHEHAGFIEKLAGLRAQGADDGSADRLPQRMAVPAHPEERPRAGCAAQPETGGQAPALTRLAGCGRTSPAAVAG